MNTHLRRPRWVAIILTIGLAFPMTSGFALQRPDSEQSRVQVVTEAVVVSVVVRDKDGRIVRDLEPEEIEVFEDGEEQEIIGFQFTDTLLDATAKSSEPQAQATGVESTTSQDPFRNINLITMIFERLGNEARSLSRATARAFLEEPLQQNTYIAIFTLNNRLSVLQPFTNDRDVLLEAVDRATSGDYTEYKSFSQERQEAYEEYAAVQREMDAGNADPGLLKELIFRRSIYNILDQADTVQREHHTMGSFSGLLSIVREQRQFAGRKTLLYFTEGMQVAGTRSDDFRMLISEANRSNVSFYGVDARGLKADSPTQNASQRLQEAAAISRGQHSAGPGGILREQVLLAEAPDTIVRLNAQENLADLSNSTGGFLVADSNDFDSAMDDIREELGAYYEVTYRPAELRYDGSFRRIDVRVSRKDTKVQSRSGYFAIPPSGGVPVLPFEIPLLAALNSPQLASDFPIKARPLRFDKQEKRTRHVLLLELPISHFSFEESEGSYRVHFSLLALIKNSQGEVVEKFSQDYPLQGPLDKLDSFKQGDVLFLRNFELEPGRYTLETVAHDKLSGETGARRSVFVVTAKEGLDASSLSVVRRVDQLPPERVNRDDPLQQENLKIIPHLSRTIAQSADSNLGLHLVIYPSEKNSESPTLLLKFVREGQVVAQASPPLPSPDSTGRIIYMAAFPGSNFEPGQYQVEAVIQQGSEWVNSQTSFTVAP